jgi:hypothetical protein
MTLMLGLSIVLGTTAAFAQDKPADQTKTEKKSKKKASKKKATETEKKS